MAVHVRNTNDTTLIATQELESKALSGPLLHRMTMADERSERLLLREGYKQR